MTRLVAAATITATSAPTDGPDDTSAGLRRRRGEGSDDQMEIQTGWTVCAGRHVAYQVFGNGPHDVLLLDLWATHLDLDWAEPFRATFLRRMASSARVIRFDKSGMGLSDRPPPDPACALETWADEAVSVLDAVGADRVGLYVADWSGPLGLTLAGRHPHRIDRAVVSTSFVALRRGEHNPDGLDDDVVDAAGTTVVSRWGSGVLSEVLDLERAALPAHQLELDRRHERCSVSRGDIPAVVDALTCGDATPWLAAIEAEVLVLYQEHPLVMQGQSEVIAQTVPHAHLEIIERRDEWRYRMAEDELPPELPRALGFLTGSATERADERRLMTLVFLDVVGSTPLAARLGDLEWSAQLTALTEAIDAFLAHHRGRLVGSAGDGFFATFEGPSSAVAFAVALRERADQLGLPVRAGVHIGECVVSGDDLRGLAIHAAARIMALAGPSEILVSDAVSQVVGDRLEAELSDRGEHELRGVPGVVRLLAVR